MKIRRYSRTYLFILAALLASSVFFATAAFYSRVTEEEYTALGLPILNINTYGKRILTRTNFIQAVYTLDGQGFHSEGDCKIRGRGNSTWKTIDTNKKPYLMKLDEEESLLGMPKARRWILKASATDKTFLRDEYAFKLAREVWNGFAWTPQLKFVTLILNGKYEGLYQLEEKVEISPGRVDIDPKDKSILFKIDEHVSERLRFVSRHDAIINIVDTDGVMHSDEEFLAIQDFVNKRERYLYAENEDGEPWTKYFDISSFVDWYLINEFTKNHDSRFQSSCYLYYDGRQDKFFMGPIWDFDIAIGNTDSAGCGKSDGYITAQACWYERLLQDEIFVTALKNRWKEKRTELADSINSIQEEADRLKAAANLNDRVWKSFGHRQWPNPSGWRNRKSYQDEIDYMVGYLRARFDWLDRQWG